MTNSSDFGRVRNQNGVVRLLRAMMASQMANPMATDIVSSNSFFQRLPNELLTSIILWLDSPRDLLHLSLTNKSFFEVIVPNILYFTNISCDIPSRFPTIWRILYEQPHLAQQIRSLDVLTEEDYTRLKDSGYHRPGFRINSQSWHSIWPSWRPRFSGFETQAIKMTDSIRRMERLAFLLMHLSLTRTDLLDILANLIAFCPSLKTLSFQVKVLQEVPALTFTPSDPVGSLPYLTAFSLVVMNGNTNQDVFLMDLVALQFPMLTDLSLINKSNFCLTLPTFFQGASWPNLRRLTLIGWLMLYPLTSLTKQRRTNLSVSFFQRHPYLECFYLSESLGSRAIERATFIRSAAFPSLRSVRASFVLSFMDIKIVERLFHIEDADIQHLPIIRCAKSLRSCSLISTDVTDIETFIDQVPHIQRLSLTWFVVLDDECSVHGSFLPLLPCTCLRDRLWNALIKLKNLTHLVIDLILDATPSYLNSLRNIAEKLPQLKYLRLRLNGVGKWTIIERRGSALNPGITHYEVEGDATFEEYKWGNFFKNWVI